MHVQSLWSACVILVYGRFQASHLSHLQCKPSAWCGVWYHCRQVYAIVATELWYVSCVSEIVLCHFRCKGCQGHRDSKAAASCGPGQESRGHFCSTSCSSIGQSQEVGMTASVAMQLCLPLWLGAILEMLADTECAVPAWSRESLLYL